MFRNRYIPQLKL